MGSDVSARDILEFLEVFSDKFKRCLRVTIEPLFEEDGLKLYHLIILAVIGRQEGMCQKEITTHLPYDKSRVSMVVTELHAMGLVENVAKGKLRSLVLTDRGREINEVFKMAVSDFTDNLLSQFKGEEREAMIHNLGLLDERLNGILAAHNH